MRVRIKKLEGSKVNRIETHGKVEEIILNEDFTNPENLKVDLCFRADNFAGIITLNANKLEAIFSKLNPKTKTLKNTKVIMLKE